MNFLLCGWLWLRALNDDEWLFCSPIGEVFRARLRQFPSLVNCCTIDWFSEWPEEALHSVAHSFLGDITEIDDATVIAGLVSCTHTNWLHTTCAQATPTVHRLLYSRYLSRMKTFANFAVSGQFAKVLTGENFHLVWRRLYEWACHCRFPPFAKVLSTKIRLSTVFTCERFLLYGMLCSQFFRAKWTNVSY